MSTYILLKAGSKGPLHVVTKHRRPGVSQVSVLVLTHGGNYGGVEFINYLQLSLMPGFTTSVREIKVQYSSHTASFSLGLDTRPDADVELFIPLLTPPSSLQRPRSIFTPQRGIQNIHRTYKSCGNQLVNLTLALLPAVLEDCTIAPIAAM